MAVFLIFGVLYALYAYYLSNGGGFWSFRSPLSKPSLPFWLSSILVLAFVVGIVGQERWLRSYDHVGYYRGTIYVATEILSKEPINWLRYLVGTINGSEYNALQCFIIAPFFRFLGTDIPTYTFLLGALGLVPFGYLVSIYTNGLAVRLQVERGLALLAGLLVYTIPALYVPLLQGMADVLVLPFAAMALLGGVALLQAFAEGKTVKQIPLEIWVSLWVSLALLPILRRYFGIYTLAWFPAIGLGLLLTAYSHKANFSRVFAYASSLLGLLILTMASWLVFPNFFFNMFIKQYGEIYKAYKSGNILEDATQMWIQFGPALWVVALLGSVTFWFIPKLRFVGVFLLSHLVLTVWGVWRIQSFSPQHYYLPSAPLAFLVIAGVFLPVAMLPVSIRAKNIFLRYLSLSVSASLILVLLGCFLLATPISAISKDVLPTLTPFASSLRLYPRKSVEVPTIQEMASDLNGLNPFGHYSVYIAGSGGNFNDDMLRNMGLPDRLNGINGLLPATDHVHIDRRDAFPKNFLTADWLLVPIPMMYHQRPEDQQLAAWIQQSVTDTTGLGRFFNPIKTYQLQEGQRVVLYRRIGALPYNDVLNSLQSIRQQYPQYPAMYNVPKPGILQESNRTFGDGPYALASYQATEGRLDMHPGANLPSIVELEATVTCNVSLKPRFVEACLEGTSVYATYLVDGLAIDSLLLDATNLPIKTVTLKGNQSLTVRVYPGEKSDFCDHLLVDIKATAPARSAIPEKP